MHTVDFFCYAGEANTTLQSNYTLINIIIIILFLKKATSMISYRVMSLKKKSPDFASLLSCGPCAKKMR